MLKYIIFIYVNTKIQLLFLTFYLKTNKIKIIETFIFKTNLKLRRCLYEKFYKG